MERVVGVLKKLQLAAQHPAAVHYLTPQNITG